MVRYSKKYQNNKCLGLINSNDYLQEIYLDYLTINKEPTTWDMVLKFPDKNWNWLALSLK